MESNTTFRERTLATRYAPRQELPSQFADVLKEYTREVLRAQPENILQWSAAYFKKLALATDPLQAQEPPPDHYAPVVEDQTRELMAQRLVKVFAFMDGNNEGVLYIHLIQRALHDHFNLSKDQILYILTCDYAYNAQRDLTSCNDTIEYRPFAFACVPAVQYFLQSKHHFECNDNDERATVHGLTKNDVEYEFLRIFRLLDESGSGRLPFVDFCNALRNAPFHLTHRDIRLQCLECDHANDADEVEYEKEIPFFFKRFLLSAEFDRFDNEDIEQSSEAENDAQSMDTLKNYNFL